MGDRLQGITSISNADDVNFTPLHENFLKRHGRKRCPCCRESGIERVVEIGPAVNGSSRLEAAVCRDHEVQGRAILQRIIDGHRPDDSYAAYSRDLSPRF